MVFFHSQAIAVLNHAGICTSYHTTWAYLRQLTTEAQYLDVVRDGHWQWVYDNINMYQRIRHERQGSLNHLVTSQL